MVLFEFRNGMRTQKGAESLPCADCPKPLCQRRGPPDTGEFAILAAHSQPTRLSKRTLIDGLGSILTGVINLSERVPTYSTK